ncbi:PREDICTED: esterase E4-like [Nicrophorus vespilloides]|uniref:Esterase E4-like n=1 Tax=Nicrophorus vespilloides TaxID=110193 RepID=A0ABM1MPC9_NICVS|nr:PREDICTED: esterase E4-like [Nicrophorus vespilloides]
MIRELTLVLLIGLSCGKPVSKTTSLHAAYPTISTPLGDIQGASMTSREGKYLIAFRGIRYAKAPLDELRFKPPVDPEKWEGVYNATQDGIACSQPDIPNSGEDCLLLNVYSPKVPKGNDSPKKPVLVFFHAGDFTDQSSISSLLGPQYLLDQDLVLVTANYRLGIFGFINTGDKEATGNYGLLDQLEALKWVKANIAAFGGNPDSVTIAGSGSGGFSVSLHLVSPLSKGLYHKAIIASGSAYGNIPILNNQLNLVKKVAKKLSCAVENNADMMKCLKEKPAKDLAATNSELREIVKDPHYTWLPTIEQDFGQNRFLTMHPLSLLNHGQVANVPIMIAQTNDEFGFKAFNVILNETLLQEYDKNFEKMAPISFIYERDTDNSKVISKALRTFYWESGKIDNTTLPKIAEIYSDALAGFAVNRAANILSEKVNESVYYYKFNFKGKLSNYYLPDTNNTSPYGVVHGDDLIYLFHNNKFTDFKENDPETTNLQKMVMIWGNFVTSGKPIPTVTDILDNVKWEPYTTKNKKYMDIGNKMVMHENLNEKRYAEWAKLFPLNKHSAAHSG